MSQIQIGEPVQDFTASSTKGDIRLSELAGSKVVLFFYPKDSTPGCTTEARGFRDAHDEFLAADTTVIGISRDSMRSHENFTEKQSLPYALISDVDEQLCLQFGVIKMKNMYGKQVRGIERSTFLLDEKGVLVREWRGLRVPGHVEQVLEAVRQPS